ncbi:hypothetical protein [Streptomyces sp. NPDC052610]|uniref:hypothetical protein n=1 Tax=Streptomyces sp. NPDC052610 TaxID=3154952 RepID=UPI00341A9BF3
MPTAPGGGADRCGARGRRTADGGRRTADGGRRTADGGRRTADGGRLVNDADAPSNRVPADPEGNEACVGVAGPPDPAADRPAR